MDSLARDAGVLVFHGKPSTRGRKRVSHSFLLGRFVMERVMKKIAKVMLSVAVVVSLSAAASAAPGRVSDRSLQKMGLQGMKAMSDEQGMKIRGTGHDQLRDAFKDVLRALDRVTDLLGGHHHK